jgi:hypothetical protein
LRTNERYRQEGGKENCESKHQSHDEKEVSFIDKRNLMGITKAKSLDQVIE